MIDKIIHFSIHNKLIIGIFTAALIAWGIYSLTELPIDAVPDITNNQVQIISIAPTLAANEVEQFITAPIEVSVSNVPDVIELRSISRLGLSVVTVVFKDKTDIFKARQLIAGRLKEAEENIPPGMAKTELAPVSTGLGEIYQYVLRVRPGFENKYDATALREIQDWIVRREILGTPGVADVNSYGGFLKEYEVAVNPDQLRAMNITLTEIFEALQKNNQNTGSSYIDKKPNAYFIRGIGLVSDFTDIENIVVKQTANGIPVLIRDVARVQFGHAPRYGAFVVDTTGEAVGGVVMMLKGGNAAQVIEDVKERVTVVQKSLPKGVYLEPYLDRTDLVSRAIGTVSTNLIEGGLIVIFILVLMLGNLRAGLIVASVIPLAMLFAISLMNVFGVSGNLMSLGAVDFGLIVDGAVIIVENVVHRLSYGKNLHQKGKLSQQEMDQEVYKSAGRMMSSAAFGQIIILIVYLPILALIGIEGKMFRPMAQTVSFAILGAILLSLTYVPAMSALFLRHHEAGKFNVSDRIMKVVNRFFTPMIDFSLKRKKLMIAVSTVMMLLTLVLFTRLGGEFIPTLEEGDLAAGVITLQGGSLSNTIETVEKANKILMTQFPEVTHAICKIGAGEIPTDPTPMETGDYIITMKPRKEWTSASTREEMMEKMEAALSVLPGVVFELQQPIQMRFNELMTGTKQDVAIKIFGDNLETLSLKAHQIEAALGTTEGISDINVEKIAGSGQVQVKYNREMLARYGLNISDVNDILRTAFAGNTAGVVYDEEKRFDLVVRFDRDFRQDVGFVENLPVPLPGGGQISLDQVASVEIKTGTAQVSRESAKRRISVGFNVRGRDVESVIDEVKKIIDAKITLPPGYYVTYGGTFENLVHARQRLGVAVPVALLLIFIILFFTFHSLRQTLLIFSAVPLSAIGGVIALYLRDMPFSISAGVGFIALFGVAVLNGIVLIAEFNRLEVEEGIMDIEARVRKGLKTRLRPVLLTASVASFGFLPMALSHSAGAEVQKPLATVVIGGLISATLLTLVVLPVLYMLFTGKKKRNLTAVPAVVLLLTALTATLAPNFSQAQGHPGSYTLEAAIRQAKMKNHSLEAALLQVEMQKKLEGAAWDPGKTEIGYSYGQMNSLRKDDDITINQSFAFPTVYINQRKLARAGTSLARNEQQSTENQVAAEVKTQYLQVQCLIAEEHLLNYRDSLYQVLVKTESLRSQQGETTSLSEASARSQLSETRMKLRQTRLQKTSALKHLAMLMAEPGNITISDTLLAPYNLPVLPDSASVRRSPLLISYFQQSEISRLEKKLEKSKLMPDFSIGYFSQSMTGTQENNGVARYYGPSDRFTGIQAGISIPLWFGSQLSKIKAARMKELSSVATAKARQNELSQQIFELTAEYNLSSEQLEYYQKQALHEAEMIQQQAMRQYLAGEIEFSDFLIHTERTLEIRMAYIEAIHHHNLTVIEIEKILGK